MNEAHERSMLIYFNDGSKKVLEFPAPAHDSDANVAARINEALDARHLVLEAEGALVVIPVASIKYLQSFPAPRKLPAYAIKGVRFKD
jgi:hypothetical protein